MSEEFSQRAKHPLWRLFGVVTLFIIVIPLTLWSIVQVYEIICTWCECCGGIDRPRTR